MSDLALYRKYRSATFSEVAGQAHIVDTITSALSSGRISHAYLFTGPRGVGKTSVARLLARAVNCTAKGPRPCNKCDICQIDLAANLDIIEIDAASNRRIDEIRDLRDKIHLAPARSRYRVYIIDEVHMLTNEAFNALLKTLEEPPSHVVFILATTEMHKLPETIVSRTQRYAFHAISHTDLTTHLQKLADAESLTLTPEALSLLAAASRGSFRDGISLLDQVANVAGSTIDETSVRRILGLSSMEGVERLGKALAENNPAAAIATLDTLTSEGSSPAQITNQLILHLREAMLAAIGTVNTSPAAKTLSEHLPLQRIIGAIETLSTASASAWPSIALEAALVRLSAVVATEPAAIASTPTPAKIPAQKAAPAPTPPPPKETPHASSGPDLNPALWPKALVLIKGRNNSLYALLCSCRIDLQPDQVTINCRFKWFKDRLDEPKNKQIIEQALDKTFGQKLRIVTAVDSPIIKQAEKPEKELVSTALEILGGEIVHG